MRSPQWPITHGLQRNFQALAITAPILGGMALILLTKDDFQQTTAVFVTVVSIMLSFVCRSGEEPTKTDTAVAWLPVVLMDLAVVEFLSGLAVWTFATHTPLRSTVLGLYLAILLGGTVTLAIWIWAVTAMSSGRKAGLQNTAGVTQEREEKK
ncbi:Sugar transporter STL1 [Purpureocillium lavendulum]|uniref:Sugar transporter STL1 n=1 Tax=Purpureocillium lavendulum TaxID=1247861 RepID=A0AB34FEB9_9HYPO|nr:Sugar transporter STL1 [Purpureocillium lavendulum]